MATAMGTAISNALNIIIKFWWLWALIIIIAVLVKFYLNIRTEKVKEFKIPELKETTRKSLGNHFDLIGIETKGKVYRSYQKIADIRRFFSAQGSFDIQYYNKTTKEFVTTELNLTTKKTTKKEKSEKVEEEYKYDLLFVEAHNKFILWRILGIKPVYFIFRWCDDEKNVNLNFNPMTESIILDSKTDLTMYGDIWTNCEEGIEYINNISMTRLNERLQALLDSTPDKFIHLEMETAKLKTKVKLLADKEKEKYKDREEAGDTTIV